MVWIWILGMAVGVALAFSAPRLVEAITEWVTRMRIEKRIKVAREEAPKVIETIAGLRRAIKVVEVRQHVLYDTRQLEPGETRFFDAPIHGLTWEETNMISPGKIIAGRRFAVWGFKIMFLPGSSLDAVLEVIDNGVFEFEVNYTVKVSMPLAEWGVAYGPLYGPVPISILEKELPAIGIASAPSDFPPETWKLLDMPIDLTDADTFGVRIRAYTPLLESRKVKAKVFILGYEMEDRR